MIFYQVYQTRQATDQDLNDSSIRQSLDPDATNYHEAEEKTIKKAKKKTKGNTTASSEESLSITPPPTPAKPVVTKDSSNDKKESKAIDTLKKLNKYNSSQGTVVRKKKVIAIEKSGGTQKMLLKCKNKKFQEYLLFEKEFL